VIGKETFLEQILEQIRATFNSGIWYPVVTSLLILPDTCGAIEFWQKDIKPRDRYAKWYDKWILPNFNSQRINFNGSTVYIVRNAMIHETTGFSRGKHGFDRIIFMPPNRNRIKINFGLMRMFNQDGVEEVAFEVNISMMLDAIELGVHNWLKDVRADPNKRRSDAIEKIIQYRPNGQLPYILGIPIIC
jgi:hypothetical protein